MKHASDILNDVAVKFSMKTVPAWSAKGPELTSIKRHGVTCIGPCMFYWQDFDDGGFEIFTQASTSIEIDETRRAIEKVVENQ